MTMANITIVVPVMTIVNWCVPFCVLTVIVARICMIMTVSMTVFDGASTVKVYSSCFFRLVLSILSIDC